MWDWISFRGSGVGGCGSGCASDGIRARVHGAGRDWGPRVQPDRGAEAGGLSVGSGRFRIGVTEG